MILGHCRDGAHAYCGGETRDQGDGTLIRCECRCHVPSEQDDAEPAELSGRGWSMEFVGEGE